MQAFELLLPRSPRRTCRVRIGRGALDVLLDELTEEPPGAPLVLISDERVAELHTKALARRLRGAGCGVELLTFPAGEGAKSRATKSRVEDDLLRLGVGRQAAVVAMGGGVTGDLAGFVAATWCRGIPVVQVPTSLLAMVDAAVGGKTAVNVEGGKNLVGAFHQPWGVYADPELLATLPEVDYVHGFAEVVKSAAIADARLFRDLEELAERLLERGPEVVERVVERCVRIKAAVVTRDERESGRRAVLNFGHTVAHAIESASELRVPHGPAVAIGMAVEARLAREATGFPARHLERLLALLQRLGLPTVVPADCIEDAIVAATYHDKKTRRREVRYALPRRLGGMPAEPTRAIDEGRLRAALARTRAD